jgi:hypothetical protein
MDTQYAVISFENKFLNTFFMFVAAIRYYLKILNLETSDIHW